MTDPSPDKHVPEEVVEHRSIFAVNVDNAVDDGVSSFNTLDFDIDFGAPAPGQQEEQTLTSGEFAEQVTSVDPSRLVPMHALRPLPSAPTANAEPSYAVLPPDFKSKPVAAVSTQTVTELDKPVFNDMQADVAGLSPDGNTEPRSPLQNMVRPVVVPPPFTAQGHQAIRGLAGEQEIDPGSVFSGASIDSVTLIGVTPALREKEKKPRFSRKTIFAGVVSVSVAGYLFLGGGLDLILNYL